MPAPACSPSATCTCGYPENRAIVEGLRPGRRRRLADRGRRRRRAGRRHRVGADACCASGSPRCSGCPATTSCGPARRTRVPLRGEARYRHLVQVCRELGVLTPEDPYPVWTGAGGPGASSRRCSCSTTTPSCRRDAPPRRRRWRRPTGAGVVCTDEHLLHPDPYPTREAWCRRPGRARPSARLDALDPDAADGAGQPLAADPAADRRAALPGVRPCGAAPTRPPTGTPRFRAAAVVYGHLHIPRDHLGGRGAVRGGVARLPARVARAAGSRTRCCGRCCPISGERRSAPAPATAPPAAPGSRTARSTPARSPRPHCAPRTASRGSSRPRRSRRPRPS